MGVNKLTSLMKTMAGKAGFEQRLTNNETRKQMMQKLNDNNVPPTHIMQLSGHRQYADNSDNMPTIQHHQTRRIMLQVCKQWQLRNLPS